MELPELRNMSEKDLLAELQKAKKELLKYKIGVRTKQKKEIHLLRKEKKHIAHIQMMLSEKRLAEKGKNA